MISILDEFRARARVGITGAVQLHSEVGLGLTEHNTATGCFRLRARAPFHWYEYECCKSDAKQYRPLKSSKNQFGY